MRCSSNTKPMFRAERVVFSEELLILASCLLRPTSRNSVLEELVSEDSLSSRRKIDLEHSESDLCWSQNESEGRKGRAECHLRKGNGLGNRRNEITEKRGVRDEEDQGQSL